MKSLLIPISLLFMLSGCASVDKELTEKYKGKVGYFKVKPNVIRISEKHQDYSPCKESSITNIISANLGPQLRFLQDDTEYQVSVENVDDYLLKNFTEIKPKYSSRNGKGVCEGYTYIGMPLSEFLALMGKPTSINSSSRGPDQYVYRHHGANGNYYYFRDGKLDSWQVSE